MNFQQRKGLLDFDLNVPAIQNPDEGTSGNFSWSEAMAGAQEGALDLDLNLPPIQNPDEGASGNLRLSEDMAVTQLGFSPQRVTIDTVFSYGEASSSNPYNHYKFYREARTQQLINYESYVNLRANDIGDEEHEAPLYDFLAQSEAIPVTRQGFVLQMVPIDVDLSDDDIILSSPRSFAEAKNNARRNRGGLIVDAAVENDRESKEEAALQSPPKHPIVNCPVCLEPVVEETTTKCGHIFCEACIKTALATRRKCPICRKKLNKKDFFRVFLSYNRR